MKTPRNILVVDDEPSMRALYKMAFTHAGHTVRAASTGEDAWEQLNQQKADMVFLDLNLPGIKGLELCKRILEHWPDTIIYAVTGYSGSFEAEACRAAGCRGMLTKPTSLAELLAAAQAD